MTLNWPGSNNTTCLVMSFMRLETKYTSNYCNITKITYILFIDVSMYQLISSWDWYQLSHVWFTCRHGQDQTVLFVSVLCTGLHFETGQNNFETFIRRQSWLVASFVHTAVTDKTRLDSRVEESLMSRRKLVWKTWKCQAFWQLSGKCQGFY